MFLVQKRLFCLLSCNNSTIHLSSYQLCSLFSFSTAEDHSSNHGSKFMLVDDPLQSCELSSKEAAKVAKDRICEKTLPSSSPSIEFFKQSGWSDAQVMKLTKKSPRLLHANVETSLKPRMKSLQDMGFSDTEIVRLVSSWPNALILRDIEPRINFWRSLLGSNEMLLKACKNMFILNYSLARAIEPSVSLLRECGISDERIVHMVVTTPACFSGIDKLKEVIKYIEELGVPRESRVYPYALNVVMCMNRSRVDATSATLMSFGFSQPDIVAAFRKCPSVWGLSQKTICDKMTFLTKEAGFELTSIICCPVILTYSLEKRMRPRYEVMNFLKQNKLLDEGHKLLSVIPLSEEKFRNRFLFRLKEKFTSPYDSYLAAVQGKPHVVT